MSEQVTNYQCPACTGPLQFSAALGKLQCEYCGNLYEVAEIEALYGEKDAAAAAATPRWDISEAGSPWSEAEAAGLRVYNCPSCGAEILCEETTAATSCMYCGNPTVVPGQLGGNLKPDFAIPFKFNRQAAIEALKKHYQNKPLLPRAFTKENHIEEIKGVYVPFWLFDCDTDATIHFNAQKVITRRDGDWDVTETSHYRVLREGSVCFEKIPVDGSSKMPDTHMDAIEPFDYSGLETFSTAYLPGYFADKYDTDADQSASRADLRVHNSTVEALGSTLKGYTSWVPDTTDIRLNRGAVRYALLPVWMLNTKWNDRIFTFAMNGQTGKLIGDLPISKQRAAAWFFGVWGGGLVAATVVLKLLGML